MFMFEKFFYTHHDATDVLVAFGRTPMPWGDRDLENRDHDRAEVAVEIDSERVE